jgi:hypothetical protein
MRRGFLAPVAAALAIRLALAAALPAEPSWDGVVYARAADRIAEGEGFTRHAIDPAEPAEPTAFYPVGWPAILAPLRWLGAGRALDPFLQSLAGAALVPLAGLLGRRGAGARGGRIAAWIAALWPGGILLSLSWLSEPTFGLLVGIASVAVAYARRARRIRALGWAAAALALAAHLRPSALPILALLAIGVAVAHPRSWGTTLRLGAAAAAIAALVLAPWSLRNTYALGGPAIVSTNGGANLLLGTIDHGGYGEIPEAIDCHETTELEQDRCRTRVALERLAAAPLDNVARALVKTAHTFGHESAPAQSWAASLSTRDPAVRESARLWSLGVSRIAWLAFLTAAIAGAAILARRRWTVLHAALLAPLLGIALLHALALSGDRYHAPAAASMAALAAIAIVAWRPGEKRAEGR